MVTETQIQGDRIKSRLLGGGWLVLFLIVAFAYWPGLKGPFVLDDFSTIIDLGRYGGVTDWDSFKAFVFGGHSGPTGRPLAMLSFLIDANNWPTDPWAFKRTNLIIHLFNGALLGVLITRILNVLDVDRTDARWIALISAACWLLHPFLVSTTLYAVQRMAQLSTIFHPPRTDHLPALPIFSTHRCTQVVCRYERVDGVVYDSRDDLKGERRPTAAPVRCHRDHDCG